MKSDSKMDLAVFLSIILIAIPGISAGTSEWTFPQRLLMEYLLFFLGMIYGGSIITREYKISKWWMRHVNKHSKWTWMP